MLGEMASSDAARLAEYRNRKPRYDQRTFRKDETDYAVSEGWEFVRENQNSFRYQKLKSRDEQLENEFWCLMDVHKSSLLAIFDAKQRIEVPLCQRQYVWSEEEQWAPLWED